MRAGRSAEIDLRFTSTAAPPKARPMLKHLPLAASVLVAITTAAAPARADVAATICRGPTSGTVRVIDDGSACTGYVRRAADGSETRVEFGRRASGQLLASASGRTVVMIDSYLYAAFGRDGRITTIGGHPVANPPVVIIYRDGKLVAAHRIHDLLGRRPRVKKSISHIRWAGELPASISDQRFTLRTESGKVLTFDSATGQVVAPARR